MAGGVFGQFQVKNNGAQFLDLAFSTPLDSASILTTPIPQPFWQGTVEQLAHLIDDEKNLVDEFSTAFYLSYRKPLEMRLMRLTDTIKATLPANSTTFSQFAAVVRTRPLTVDSITEPGDCGALSVTNINGQWIPLGIHFMHNTDVLYMLDPGIAHTLEAMRTPVQSHDMLAVGIVGVLDYLRSRLTVSTEQSPIFRLYYPNFPLPSTLPAQLSPTDQVVVTTVVPDAGEWKKVEDITVQKSRLTRKTNGMWEHVKQL